MQRKVLVVGSGGREHALAWNLAQSSDVRKVYVAPGNPGVAYTDKCVSVSSIKPMDFPGLFDLIEAETIDLTVIGPEDPICAGFADRFREKFDCRDHRVFAPSQMAAMLESSKGEAFIFMRRHGIPTGETAICTSRSMADSVVASHFDCLDDAGPIVIKANGLAAGKGVVVAYSQEEAQVAINRLIVQKEFGCAGDVVVIMEYLPGEELSVFIMTDGKDYLILPPSQDHKRLQANDLGPNTGGMGAYAPVSIATPELMVRIEREIIQPTILGLADEGRPYVGFLYFGLMIGPDGSPKVIEYNCRLGDPETQAVLPLIRGDITSTMWDGCTKRIGDHKIEVSHQSAVCIVLASAGYPKHPIYGELIEGNAYDQSGLKHIFHAGTALDEEGRLLTKGGRVVGITALGDNIRQATERAYLLAETIQFRGRYFRSDIAIRELKRAQLAISA